MKRNKKICFRACDVHSPARYSLRQVAIGGDKDTLAYIRFRSEKTLIQVISFVCDKMTGSGIFDQVHGYLEKNQLYVRHSKQEINIDREQVAQRTSARVASNKIFSSDSFLFSTMPAHQLRLSQCWIFEDTMSRACSFCKCLAKTCVLIHLMRTATICAHISLIIGERTQERASQALTFLDFDERKKKKTLRFKGFDFFDVFFFFSRL